MALDMPLDRRAKCCDFNPVGVGPAPLATLPLVCHSFIYQTYKYALRSVEKSEMIIDPMRIEYQGQNKCASIAYIWPTLQATIFVL